MSSGTVRNKKVPTVDDLRVKQCYICLEEERYDDPDTKSKEEWVHPCKCTLIAHQSCLMKVLFRKRVRKSELKCPQCRYQYKIQRNPNLVLACLLFEIGDKLTSLAGTTAFIAGTAGILTLTVTGVMGVGSAYGAWAVRQFFGEEIYSLLLTDDPGNWPAQYFILLPTLAFRTIDRSTTGVGTFTPLFFWWPSMPPAPLRHLLLEDSKLIQNVSLSSRPTRSSAWPPSFTRFRWLVLFSNVIYGRAFSRFSHWVLGTKPDHPRSVPRRGLLNILTLGFLGEEGNGDQNQRNARGRAQAQAQAQNQDQQDDVELDPIRIRRDVPFGLLEKLTKIGEFTILLGLAKPLIARGMGHLLYLASMHSKTLRYLLGIRRPPVTLQTLLSQTKAPSPKLVPDLLDPEMDNTWYWRYFTEQAVEHMDPVWIRNSVGLSLFVAAKDFLHLLHLWITKRELTSRRLKSRPFDDVDPAQLDLINPQSRE